MCLYIYIYIYLVTTLINCHILCFFVCSLRILLSHHYQTPRTSLCHLIAECQTSTLCLLDIWSWRWCHLLRHSPWAIASAEALAKWVASANCVLLKSSSVVLATVHASGLTCAGCPGRNVPDFGRMFLKLKYTDLTQNTYIRSWTVMEIMAREKCGLLAVQCTVPGSRDVLPIHCACPSFNLQPGEAYSRCDCTCKVLGTLRTTATLVRVFM